MSRQQRPTETREMTCKDMILLPPAKGLCQDCAVSHDPAQPHNKNSHYYQIKFKMAYNRWPTWEDAMSHCPEDVKKVWTEELTKRGIPLCN